MSFRADLKNTLNGTTTGMKNFGSQSSTAGGIITTLASKAAIAIGAFVLKPGNWQNQILGIF